MRTNESDAHFHQKPSIGDSKLLLLCTHYWFRYNCDSFSCLTQKTFEKNIKVLKAQLSNTLFCMTVLRNGIYLLNKMLVYQLFLSLPLFLSKFWDQGVLFLLHVLIRSIVEWKQEVEGSVWPWLLSTFSISHVRILKSDPRRWMEDTLICKCLVLQCRLISDSAHLWPCTQAK